MSINTANENQDFTGAIEVFNKALAGFQVNNPLPWFNLLSEDAILELPFNPPGLSQRLIGKASILAYFQTTPASIDFNNFTDIQIYSLNDPNTIIIELSASGTLKTTGETYGNRYVIVLKTENGFIKLQRDYFNPNSALSSVR